MSRTPDREDRARSHSQPRSTSSPGSLGTRKYSRDRSMSPFHSRTNRAQTSGRRNSGFASSGSRSRSRSPAKSPPYTPSRSPSKTKCSEPVWQQQMKSFAYRALQIYMGHSVLYDQPASIL